MTLYPSGYGSTKLSLADLYARHAPRCHPEYAKRLFTAIKDANGLVGIGNGWRSTETQATNHAKYPNRFAPPGYSFHEVHLWSSGIVAFAAVDIVGIDGRHGEAFDWMKRHGLRYGLLTFWNVNNEPWHVQCSDLPKSVRQWKNAGRPEPGVWDLPALDFGDDDHDPVETPETNPQPNPGVLNQTEQIVQQLPTLRIGAKGEDVQTVQALLNARMSSLNVVEDGDFGPQTHAAVKKFQSSVGITSDGVVGRVETWPALLLV